MNELNIMFFGSLSGRVNNVVLSNALDDLAATSNKYLENREHCIDIYEVFDDLRYDLSYLDMKLGSMSYDKKNKEYKFPLILNENTIGIVLIDQEGSARVMYDKLKAMEMDSIELEVQIEILLTSGKAELIDTIMSMLQFARPIPLNNDSFIVYIGDQDKSIIKEFFNRVFIPAEGSSNFDRPYFLTIKNTGNNFKEAAELISNRMNTVLEAFENTKLEFFNGISDNLTADDLEVINTLIEFTVEDAIFYEKILNEKIIDNLKLK